MIKQVEIEGFDFEVVVTEEQLYLNGKQCEEIIDALSQRITLSAEPHPQRQAANLLHAIVHAIGDKRELELSESQVQGIALGLWNVLRRNRQLIDYLYGLFT